MPRKLKQLDDFCAEKKTTNLKNFGIRPKKLKSQVSSAKKLNNSLVNDETESVCHTCENSAGFGRSTYDDKTISN